jgi:dephospho-CoA kinase
MARLKHAPWRCGNEITRRETFPLTHRAMLFPVTLVWVTGNSGAGKSTVCEFLKSAEQLAFDADWEGFNRWVDRADNGNAVTDPPYPVPAGWLDRFAWKIDQAKVEALAARTRDETAFLCGSAENEEEVLDLFDLVVCLIIDNETLLNRLQARTTNAFGQHPEELAAALQWNDGEEATYRALGATIIDGSQPVADIAATILATAAKSITSASKR